LCIIAYKMAFGVVCIYIHTHHCKPEFKMNLDCVVYSYDVLVVLAMWAKSKLLGA
jgi:hypothetical protein